MPVSGHTAPAPRRPAPGSRLAPGLQRCLTRGRSSRARALAGAVVPLSRLSPPSPSPLRRSTKWSPKGASCRSQASQYSTARPPAAPSPVPAPTGKLKRGGGRSCPRPHREPGPGRLCPRLPPGYRRPRSWPERGVCGVAVASQTGRFSAAPGFLPFPCPLWATLRGHSGFSLFYRSLSEPEPMSPREVQGPAQSHRLLSDSLGRNESVFAGLCSSLSLTACAWLLVASLCR